MTQLPTDFLNIPAGAEDCSVLRKVLCFAELDSTNDYLKGLARSGEPEGTVVLADRQGAGHGRHGRSWFSPPGRNLYLSALLRPSLAPSKSPLLSLLAAVCVAECVRAACGIRPGIKWPNDVLLRGKKCAGVLVDLEADARGISWVVVGIGLNVNGREWPEEIRASATSLGERSGKELDRGRVALTLIRKLDAGYVQACGNGFASVRENWLGYDMLAGERIRVTEQGKVTEGVVAGYDDMGAILLRNEEGDARKVLSGEVERVRRV